MFEDNEKEVIEAEETNEVETKAEETKTETKAEETSSNNGGKKYHLIQENFKKALMWAIIGCAAMTIIWILDAIFCAVIEGNAENIVISAIYAVGCAAMIFVGIVELKLFLGETNAKRGEDLASFLISLIAFIIAFITAFWFGIDAIQRLVWFIRGL